MSKSRMKRLAIQRGTKVYKHTVMPCPKCAYTLDHAACDDGVHRGPTDGDITMCLRCRTLLTFANGMSELRVLTGDELAALPVDLQENLKRIEAEAPHPPARRKLICQQAITSAVVVPGTRFDLVCATCKVNVGVAPSGQAALREHEGNIDIVCNECFAPKDGDEFFAAPGALEEFKATRGE